jgi:hypothetical protein
VSFREKTDRLTRTAALDCIPLPSAAVRPKRLDNGLVELSYPVAMRPFWGAIARRFGVSGQSRRRLELDELGTAVWDLIDSRRSVREVAGAFARRFQLHDQESQASVVAFLRELGRRGIIGMKEQI